MRNAYRRAVGGLPTVIPLVFTSSTFVPVATFPGMLRTSTRPLAGRT